MRQERREIGGLGSKFKLVGLGPLEVRIGEPSKRNDLVREQPDRVRHLEAAAVEDRCVGNEHRAARVEVALHQAGPAAGAHDEVALGSSVAWLKALFDVEEESGDGAVAFIADLRLIEDASGDGRGDSYCNRHRLLLKWNVAARGRVLRCDRERAQAARWRLTRASAIARRMHARSVVGMLLKGRRARRETWRRVLASSRPSGAPSEKMVAPRSVSSRAADVRPELVRSQRLFPNCSPIMWNAIRRQVEVGRACPAVTCRAVFAVD